MGSWHEMGIRYGYEMQNEDGPVSEAGFGTGSDHEVRIETESGLETGAGTRSEPVTERIGASRAGVQATGSRIGS